MRRALFLDRDGTLVVEKNYLKDPADVVLLPGVGEALNRLQKAGFALFIVTNQSGIGRGYYTLEDMERVNRRVLDELARYNVTFVKLYFAPEAPETPSRGRKPSPQFLFDARDEFGIELSQSYMVGDKISDLECGWNAGVKKSILVRTGYGREAENKLSPERRALLIVDDLVAAADWITVEDSSYPAQQSDSRSSLKRIVGIIPARYGSTRFPGKPLALVAGKPVIRHVVEQCRKSKSLSDVVVATDDSRIREAVASFCRVEMTRADHPSGSDRIAEVAERESCDGVVNVQGDEPLIDPEVIDAVAQSLVRHDMSTAATPIREADEYDNPNVVKVVVSRSGAALYFSRWAIPYIRDAAKLHGKEALAAFPFLKHLGIYGYRRETLLRLVRLPVSALERMEKLEQLRALENDIQIGVVEVRDDSVGVDAPEDIARVEQLLREKESKAS